MQIDQLPETPDARPYELLKGVVVHLRKQGAILYAFEYEQQLEVRMRGHEDLDA